jgi:glutamate dehydrogenase
VPDDAQPLAAHAEELREAGVPDPLATRIAGLSTIFATFDVVEVAADTGLEVATVARVYFRLGHELQLHWLRDRIVELPRDNRWRALARAALRDDLYALHRALTAEALKSGDPGDPEQLVSAWVEANPNSERTLQTLRDIQVGRTFDLTTLPVGVREVRNLI